MGPLAISLLALMLGAALSASTPAGEDEDAPVPVLRGGGFEAAEGEGDGARPVGWERPDGLGARWVAREDGAGRCLLLDTRVSERAICERWRELGMDDKVFPGPTGGPIAATYGLSFYGDPLPVEPDQAYRVRFRFRGPAGAKVWVRGYGEQAGRKRRRYEAVALGAATEEWRSFSHVFHPTRHTPRVTEMRIMLYAYHPAGEYRFDDLVIEPIDAETYERERRRNLPPSKRGR